MTPHSSDLSSGLVRSTDAQQKDANALVDKLGPYEGDNIPALLNFIADQLDQLRPFFAPEGEGGGQAMWDENDPMLDIMIKGLTLIYTHIEGRAAAFPSPSGRG
ncbi:hypothetical protein KSD_80560 [Ktedonobacter sp. SOSP1-85]|nr:hypothetical protein KSD_80560 [Ktedonobacter sp. SOSP1-85]